MVISLTNLIYTAIVVLLTGSTPNSCKESPSRICGKLMQNLPDTTIRPWGYYRVLHTVGSNVKLKELTVEPGKSLSMQKHNHRSELWFVAEGIATLNTYKDDIIEHVCDYGLYQYVIIDSEDWHQLQNNQDFPLKIIEIQYGDKCIEEDITRVTL
jgi:mannose-6-phosphate isomerase-like protein (cupin superfamily)